METENTLTSNDLLNDIQMSIDKYKNNELMNQKIKSLLKNIPKMIEQIKIKEDKRKNYIEEMNNEQENFIKNFLANYHYFYIRDLLFVQLDESSMGYFHLVPYHECKLKHFYQVSIFR